MRDELVLRMKTGEKAKVFVMLSSGCVIFFFLFLDIYSRGQFMSMSGYVDFIPGPSSLSNLHPYTNITCILKVEDVLFYSPNAHGPIIRRLL